MSQMLISMFQFFFENFFFYFFFGRILEDFFVGFIDLNRIEMTNNNTFDKKNEKNLNNNTFLKVLKFIIKIFFFFYFHISNFTFQFYF